MYGIMTGQKLNLMASMAAESDVIVQLFILSIRWVAMTTFRIISDLLPAR